MESTFVWCMQFLRWASGTFNGALNFHLSHRKCNELESSTIRWNQLLVMTTFCSGKPYFCCSFSCQQKTGSIGFPWDGMSSYLLCQIQKQVQIQMKNIDKEKFIYKHKYPTFGSVSFPWLWISDNSWSYIIFIILKKKRLIHSTHLCIIDCNEII